ncbi:MAG: glycosyltransferase family 4 protein [Acidobacteriota bacterium]|nr:glycosyltransferase family 4 protein [Acidobacteriota bacterium]
MRTPEVFQKHLSPAEEVTTGAAHPRVVFLTNIIPPYHKPLLDRLSRRYVHMRILLSTRMESNRAWKLEWEGLDVVVQKTLTLNGLWRHPKGFRERLYIHLPLDTISQLRRFKADVVISWEMGTRTMLAAAYRWTHRGSRLIVWAEFAESTEYGRGYFRQSLRKVLHHAIDAFLVTGESGARYLRHIGVPDRKIFKIAYTTDVQRFADAPITRTPESAWRLLYVGQLIARKGLLEFLSVLSRWAMLHPERQVEFVLAGNGPLRESLQTMPIAPSLKLTFLGEVAYDILTDVYRRAGLFVLPTFADTWGVVVNEAMAAGLPILGSVYGQAVSELVEDEVSGWTFRPDVAEEMLDAIDKSLNTSREKLDEMRAAARAMALRFTPEYVSELIESAITASASQAERGRAHG